VILCLIFTNTFLFSQNADAESEAENDKSLSPYFLVKSENPETDQLPLKSTSADVNIVGVIADVTVNQVYKNEGVNALEAVYTFPASTNAAVYAMEMTIGDRKIIAKIEEKKKAREDYEAAKKAGKRASLLEQQRPNVFTMNVANIMPDDEIMVSLKYTEYLSPTDGIYQFVYPTVVGPRYVSKEKEREGNDFANKPYQREGEAASYDFDIKTRITAGMQIQEVVCNTHKTKIDYPEKSTAQINLADSENKGGNRDFVLDYKLSGDQIESGLMLYEGEDENFFLLMVHPPKRFKDEDIPPREFIFINDVSGSMTGHPMDVSKKLMKNLVCNMRPEDRFNVLVFAGASGWLADKSLEVSDANIEQAKNFIDNQRGGGGTNILPALKKALTFPRQYEELSRIFVIVTDGYVTVESEVFDLIRENNNKANTFVFGIGDGVNRHLIEGMAHVGMGEPFIVMKESEADMVAEKFQSYISNPVLTQIQKSFSKFDAYDIEPITVPDVMAERPITIFGKYKGNATGEISLEGYAGKNKWKKVYHLGSVQPTEKNEALKYLWARKRIQMLDDYGQTSGGSNFEERKKKVTDLGLKYNLLTKYTSFIAIEETPVNTGDVKTVKQALPLPQNVSENAIGFDSNLGGTQGVVVSGKRVFSEALDSPVALDLFYSKELASTGKPRAKLKIYKKVKLEGNYSKEERAQIINRIENIFINDDFNKCFDLDFDISSIEFEVDENGKVVKIVINDNMKFVEFNDCVEFFIGSWDFSRMPNKGVGTYKITY